MVLAQICGGVCRSASGPVAAEPYALWHASLRGGRVDGFIICPHRTSPTRADVASLTSILRLYTSTGSIPRQRNKCRCSSFPRCRVTPPTTARSSTRVHPYAGNSYDGTAGRHPVCQGHERLPRHAVVELLRACVYLGAVDIDTCS